MARHVCKQLDVKDTGSWMQTLARGFASVSDALRESKSYVKGPTKYIRVLVGKQEQPEREGTRWLNCVESIVFLTSTLTHNPHIFLLHPALDLLTLNIKSLKQKTVCWVFRHLTMIKKKVKAFQGRLQLCIATFPATAEGQDHVHIPESTWRQWDLFICC